MKGSGKIRRGNRAGEEKGKGLKGCEVAEWQNAKWRVEGRERRTLSPEGAAAPRYQTYLITSDSD